VIPRPVAIGLTLCDTVIVEEKTKKVSLIGSFSGIAADSFPVVAQPFSVYSLLTDGSGTATIDLVVSRLDTGEDVFSFRGQVNFPDKLAEISFHARLRKCTFPASGLYQFTLFVNKEWVAQRWIRVYMKEGLS
jgi:hypothetical protein